MLDDRFNRAVRRTCVTAPMRRSRRRWLCWCAKRLTGPVAPAAAKRLVELWRPLIEGRAGRDLDRLERVFEDQRRFGDAVHDLLDALDMGEDRSNEATRRKASRATRIGARTNPENKASLPIPKHAADEARSGRRRQRRIARRPPKTPPDASSAEMAMTANGEGTARPAVAGATQRPQRAARPDYRPITMRFGLRPFTARELCEPGRTRPLRSYLDKQLIGICKAWWRGSPRLQRG